MAAAGACAQPSLQLDLTGAQYTAVERLAGGQVANAERGRLSLQVAALGPLAGGHWRLSAQALQGRVDYEGRSQIGWPIRSSSQIDAQEARLSALRPLGVTGPLQWQAEASLGWRRLSRRIAPTLLSTPLSETLDWGHLQLGLHSRWAWAAGWSAEAGAQLEQGLAARLAVDFHGLADAARVTPGRARIGHAVQLGLARDGPGGLSLHLQWGQARQAYGGSDWVPQTRAGLPIGQLRYPGSSQGLDSLSLGLRWRLP